MPPKQAKSKAAIKAEVTEKVREIRLRQQKWMEQRESSIKSPAVTSQGKQNSQRSQPSPKPAEIPLSSPTLKPQGPLTDVETSKPVTPANTDKTTGFKTWLTNQEKPKENANTWEKNQSGLYDPENYSSANGVGHSEKHTLPPLDLPSSRSTISDMTLPETASDYSSQRTVGNTLAPEQFDALADEIVNRVKREIKLEARDIDESREDVGPNKADMGNSALPKQVTSTIASHHCPVCGQIMVNSYRPMLLIPCGHSACQSCSATSRYEECPICGMLLQSATPNIMLQQIILDYHQGTHNHSELHTHSEVSQDSGPVQSKRLQSVLTPSDQQRNYLGKTYSQLPPDKPPEQPGKTAAEYEDEYRNLLLRCDVLQEEEASITDRMAALEQDKQSEREQIENISEAQARIRSEIETLEQRVTDLERHKDSYRGKIEDLDGQKNKERRKLEMVRTTVSQLKGEMKKIKTALEKR